MASLQRFHGTLVVHFRDAVILGFEAALQEEVAHALHEFIEVDGVRRLTNIFSVANYFHKYSPESG